MSTTPDIKIVLCIGSGYVGALTMTMFANYHPEIKFYVFDVFKSLIDKYNNVKDEQTLPIVEKDLYTYFQKVFNKNLFFISEISDEILCNVDVVFVCVNTPSITNYNYGTDISIEDLKNILYKGIELSMENVYNCVKSLVGRIVKLENENPKEMKKKIFIQKSTVAIQTLEHLHKIIQDIYKENKSTLTEEEIDYKISLLNIPEFLAEGNAIHNLLNPDRVVIGYLRDNKASYEASKKMKNFYLPFLTEDKIIEFDSISSEMTKLVSNAFLAQRLSSINSISELCEKTRANIHSISKSVGTDKRIGNTYLKASMGFGGSCFKKDVLSLIFIFSNLGLNIQAMYWGNVILMNEYQRIRICQKIVKASQGKTVGIMGLAFKGNIGDVRSANSAFILSYLLNNKIPYKMYDPYSEVIDLRYELQTYDNEKDKKYDYNSLSISRDFYETCKDCSVLVFTNNHDVFKTVDLKRVCDVMDKDSKVIFDTYDNFSLEQLSKEQFKIFKLGEYDEIDC
jgi:UDPglucose 6-dehydrogenase